MGWGGCWGLCSGVNSCTPLQGLITQVSLEILATETPGGRGVGKRSECSVRHASAAFLCKSSSLGTFLLERIYFTSLSKMSLSIFSSEWGLRTCNQSGCLYVSKACVTDMLLSSKIARWQLSWISIWVHIAFITFMAFSFPAFLLQLFPLFSLWFQHRWEEMSWVFHKNSNNFDKKSGYETEEPLDLLSQRTLEYVKHIHVWCDVGYFRCHFSRANYHEMGIFPHL